MALEETPEDRLEAALERIARIVEAGPPTRGGEAVPRDPVVDQVADRLDRIIETLRDALGK